MNPRPQTAGTAGIIAGVLLAVLLILFMTSGMRPEAMADPGKMMAYAGQNAGRWRNMAFIGIVTTIAAVFYFPGLAARLLDRTPSRAKGVPYYRILCIGGYDLVASPQSAGDPACAM